MRAIAGRTSTRRGHLAHPMEGLWLKRMLERAPVAMCLVAGSERCITVANAAFRELVREERLIGRPLAALLPACEAAIAEASALQKLSSGQPVGLAEQPVELGSVRRAERLTWLVVPLAKQGECRHLLIVAMTSLQWVQRESALPARRDMIAQLVHELRGPLAPMRAAIALLQSCEPEILERVRAILHRQIEAISRLIHDLYELARSEGTQLALLRDRISVDGLVERAIELAQPLVQARRHSLTVDVEPGQWIDADAGRLVQVLANLLINAAKYTDVGGKIWLHGRMTVSHFVFCVRDNGIGIAPEVLPHVFEAFVRSSRARRREHDGSGLGLSVVRSIVQQHGGTVEVHSDGPDRGSEFIVTLPQGQPSTRCLARVP